MPRAAGAESGIGIGRIIDRIEAVMEEIVEDIAVSHKVER